MTIDTYSKDQIIADLQVEQQAIHDTVTNMPEDKLFTGTDTEWSPEGYLKHLIISVKAFAKALLLPRDQIEAMFGKADGSKTFDELVADYEKLLTEGLQAENVSNITPVNYRMPEGIEDEKTYLIETWNEGNNRLYANLETWSEEDLDSYCIPHPALGMITVREMLFFTIHHNRGHAEDIKRGGER